MKSKHLINLIRPQQWAKNIFVALPLFFNGSLFDIWCWHQTIVAFIAFSMTASAIYCLNDILDIEADRHHPKKKFRPIAAGHILVRTAYAIMALLILLALASCFLLTSGSSLHLMSIILTYFILNIAYCMWLKQFAIIDVFIISLGFVLRLFAGGTSCHIWLSPWIVLMTFLIALFLAFAKRYDDVLIRNSTGIETRKNTHNYNIAFLNQTLGIIGAITVVCYISYTVSPEVENRMGSGYVYITSIFVIAGILRYLQVTIVDGRSGSPTKILFHDHFIHSCLTLWIIVFLFIIYL